MSTSPDSNVRGFIHEMRKLGAVRVCVGDVVVEFPSAEQASDEPAAEPLLSEADRKNLDDQLMYGSSV